MPLNRVHRHRFTQTVKTPWLMATTTSVLRRALTLSLAPAVLLAALAACERGLPPGEAGPAVIPPQVAPAAAPWATPALKAVVDLQVERDGAALQALLEADEAPVRARAALALASVQDPEATDGLVALLDDSEPAVRMEAAFALGQLPLPNDGRPLVEALEGEGEAAVREQLIRALGIRGGTAAAEALVALEPADAAQEAQRMLALSRLGMRGVTPAGLMDTLVEGLTHPEPDVRKAASYLFGRSGSPELWSDHAPRVREILDGYRRDEPAAMNLVIAVGVLREQADVDRILGWATEGEDWRIRTNAIRALGSQPMLEASGVRDALFERLETDPSYHVRIAAANTLTMGLFVPQPVQARMAEWLRTDAPQHWRTHVPFAQHLAGVGREELILEWARRVEGVHPAAAARGLELISMTEGDEATRFIWEMTEHRNTRVRALALAILGQRWAAVIMDDQEVQEIFEVLVDRVAEGEPAEVQRALDALVSPAYGALDREGRVLETIIQRAEAEESVPTLVSLLEALEAIGFEDAAELTESFLDHEDLRVQRAAAAAHRRITGREVAEVDETGPERTVDWEALEALGPEPRLFLETERGEVVIRMLPAQAPLTVQTVAELAEAGRYDDSPFHRVIPNFMVQGGDVTMGDGSGSPGFAIRSEFTRIPFQRGIIAMASAGKDTEDSQFFVTHSMQPHLDGEYTAFGWVESGEGALDGILEGDVVVRARVAPGSGG